MPMQTLETKPRSIVQHYRNEGYVLLRNVIPQRAIDVLLTNYLSMVERITARQFKGAHDPALAAYFNENPNVESDVYLKIRETPWLSEFSRQAAIVHAAQEILGDCGLFAKIPFRIDMPMWTSELAVWHQDYFYVRGNIDIVTAWIPFQNTTYFNGCLSVMPGSHKLGPVEHDVEIGKKRVPSTIFNREIRMVEMNAGDVLLFNALLLHSGNLNMSPSIRYSLQPRFTPRGATIDPGMGEVIAL